LESAQKSRAKIQQKRRLPTRASLRQKSDSLAATGDDSLAVPEPAKAAVVKKEEPSTKVIAVQSTIFLKLIIMSHYLACFKICPGRTWYDACVFF
jgi:hypothetical protein